MAAIQTSKFYLTLILILNCSFLSFIGFKLQISSCSRQITSFDGSVDRNIRVDASARASGTSDITKTTSKEDTSPKRFSSANDTIWMFSDEYLEKIYIYDKLIHKEQTLNKTNLHIFRKQLFASIGEDFNNKLIIHQSNTPVNSRVKYNQLKKFFNVTEKYHLRLPKNYTPGNYDRCTVVGNSGTLLNSKCGENIDNADFVYRCNAAPIEPFKEDAGSKTNVTTFNPSILGRRYGRVASNDTMAAFIKDMKKYQGIVMASCFSNKAYAKECVHVLGNYTNTKENMFVFAHPDHFQKIETFWRTMGFKKRLSSGFYLATSALTHCDEVHLYGFWPFTLKPTANSFEKTKYHYYDKMSYNVNSKKGPHGMSMEFAVLVQLHLRGILKLHIGVCSAPP